MQYCSYRESSAWSRLLFYRESSALDRRLFYRESSALDRRLFNWESSAWERRLFYRESSAWARRLFYWESSAWERRLFCMFYRESSEWERRLFFVIPFCCLVETVDSDAGRDDAVRAQHMRHLDVFLLEVTPKFLVADRKCGEQLLNGHRRAALYIRSRQNR